MNEKEKLEYVMDERDQLLDENYSLLFDIEVLKASKEHYMQMAMDNACNAKKAIDTLNEQLAAVTADAEKWRKLRLKHLARWRR